MQNKLKNKWIELFNDILNDDNESNNEKIELLKNSTKQFDWKRPNSQSMPFYSTDINKNIINEFNKGKINHIIYSDTEKHPMDAMATRLSILMLNDLADDMMKKSLEIKPKIVMESTPTVNSKSQGYWNKIFTKK